MPNIGVKHLLRDEIVAALKTSPCVEHLNTADGDGVYPSERLGSRDGYAVPITPFILVEMPVQTGSDSVGPSTTTYATSTECYIYFSEQDDKEADELASEMVSAARIALAASSYAGHMRKIGGFPNCFEVNDVGWGMLGQDKCYAFRIDFTSSMNTNSMVSIP